MTDYSKFNCFQVSKPSEFVLHVQFNKPKKLNAVNQECVDQKGPIRRSYEAFLRSGMIGLVFIKPHMKAL